MTQKIKKTPEFVWYLEDKSYKYGHNHFRYIELIKAPVVRETPCMYIIDSKRGEVVTSNYACKKDQWVPYRERIDKEACYLSEYTGASEYIYCLKKVIEFNASHMKADMDSMERMKKWIDNY